MHPRRTTMTTAAQFDFDDLLSMRPQQLTHPFSTIPQANSSFHPAALALNSLYFSADAATLPSHQHPAPVPPPLQPTSAPLLPDFPQLDHLFTTPSHLPDPVPSLQVSNPLSLSAQHSYSLPFGSSTISTLTPPVPTHLSHRPTPIPTQAPAPAPAAARAPAPVQAPAPTRAPVAAATTDGTRWTYAGSGAESNGSADSGTAGSINGLGTSGTRRRKSNTTATLDKDKLEERRRKNRLSSSKCYYNRKRQIELVERTLTSEKRKAITLYARELDLRNENARLKKELVLRNIRIPATFLTTTRTDTFVRPPPVAHAV